MRQREGYHGTTGSDVEAVNHATTRWASLPGRTQMQTEVSRLSYAEAWLRRKVLLPPCWIAPDKKTRNPPTEAAQTTDYPEPRIEQAKGPWTAQNVLNPDSHLTYRRFV